MTTMTREQILEMPRIFTAHVMANLWCLLHFGHCVLTMKVKAESYPEETVLIETGKGSLSKGTWKTSKVFYSKAALLAKLNTEGKP